MSDSSSTSSKSSPVQFVSYVARSKESGIFQSHTNYDVILDYAREMSQELYTYFQEAGEDGDFGVDITLERGHMQNVETFAHYHAWFESVEVLHDLMTISHVPSPSPSPSPSPLTNQETPC
jgi:hypothetical protein